MVDGADSTATAQVPLQRVAGQAGRAREVGLAGPAQHHERGQLPGPVGAHHGLQSRLHVAGAILNQQAVR